MKKEEDIRKRINITLREDTVALIDRVTDNRSRFIDVIIRDYVKSKGRKNLRKHLEEGYLRRGNQDLQLAQEWFSLEEGVWQNGK